MSCRTPMGEFSTCISLRSACSNYLGSNRAIALNALFFSSLLLPQLEATKHCCQKPFFNSSEGRS